MAEHGQLDVEAPSWNLGATRFAVPRSARFKFFKLYTNCVVPSVIFGALVAGASRKIQRCVESTHSNGSV